MDNIKLSNIFVIPVVVEDLSRSATDTYIYLYCIEKGLRPPSNTECLLLHLKKDFPFIHYLYAYCSNIRWENHFERLLGRIGNC